MYLINMIKINKVFLGFILTGLFVLPAFIGAQEAIPTTPGTPTNSNTNISVKFNNPLKCGDNCTLMGLITLILNNVIMPIAAVAVVLYIIWAGFKFVTAQGNPKKIEEARDNLLWALIGAGILLGAAAISEVVKRTVESLK